MATVSETHECEWKDAADKLRSENDTLKQRLEKLEKVVFGRKSEKLPRIRDELQASSPKSREATLKERSEKRAAKDALPERTIRHEVAAAKRRCPKCGSDELRPLGEGKRTVVYEYVPARLEKQVHIQQTLSCRCGAGIVTAEAPKAIEKGQYGPGLIAHVVTAKCLDSIPLYRQRAGVPVARTALGDLFHAAAGLTEPLYKRLLELMKEQRYVCADKTPQRVLAKGKTRRAYVWTFRTDKLIAYVHSHGRSGDTPVEVLGGTKGHLQVDAYSGYNAVTLPNGRVRVGCWAHVRRKFHEALSTAPEAQAALELILELYRIEHEVDAAGERGTARHLDRRSTETAAVLERIRA